MSAANQLDLTTQTSIPRAKISLILTVYPQPDDNTNSENYKLPFADILKYIQRNLFNAPEILHIIDEDNKKTIDTNFVIEQSPDISITNNSEIDFYFEFPDHEFVPETELNENSTYDIENSSDIIASADSTIVGDGFLERLNNEIENIEKDEMSGEMSHEMSHEIVENNQEFGDGDGDGDEQSEFVDELDKSVNVEMPNVDSGSSSVHVMKMDETGRNEIVTTPPELIEPDSVRSIMLPPLEPLKKYTRKQRIRRVISHSKKRHAK